MNLALSTRLKMARERSRFTQTDLAKRMGSSRSRVAKMEAGDPGVSLGNEDVNASKFLLRTSFKLSNAKRAR